MKTQAIRLGMGLVISLGMSAMALAAGAGTSGSTGGQAVQQVSAAQQNVASVATQDPSGRGARNPVEHEPPQANTVVNNRPAQAASGIGARNPYAQS